MVNTCTSVGVISETHCAAQQEAGVAPHLSIFTNRLASYSDIMFSCTCCELVTGWARLQLGKA